VPLLRDLRHYRKAWLSHDVIAGLSVTAVQVPTAIAYATLEAILQREGRGAPDRDTSGEGG
jgi:MFS superfamily sulfate permease-like transporter